MAANKLHHVLVLGAGNFGTCLAQHLAQKGNRITIWSVEEDVVTSINEHHRNPKYHSSAILSEQVAATNRISREMVKACSAIVLAIPTQAMRSVLQQFQGCIPADMLIVCAAKGIEIDTLALPIQVIEQTLGEDAAQRACFLSGPSFAEEIMSRQPTAVSIASFDEEACATAQELFHAPFFRAYSSRDPIGLEVAGALKNVIAIAAGAVVGLGFQNNSRAALLTRGLAELVRVGIALGANPLTFNGLGGVGDLFLTCTSEKSRNFTVGYRLGQGEALQQVVSTVGSVAEGVYTAKAAYLLSQKLQVSTPICNEVYKVLYENKPITSAVTDLLTREPKAELD